MIMRSFRRTAAVVAVGAGLFSGVVACGSSSSTSADDPAAPSSSTTASAPESPVSPESPETSTSAVSSDPASSPATDDVMIRVDAPADGTTVSGTLQASGVANSPEANVPWQITSAAGTVVKSGHATADGWMDKAYPWKKRIDVSDLAPGTYTFTARVDDDSDGEGSTPPSASVAFQVS